MEEITLLHIEKKENIITYQYRVTKGISEYFSDEIFFIEYPINIESVPDAIAAVPFVSNVLPIMWLTDCKLSVKELDQAFYDCIPYVKKGYETMFPESQFLGNLCVEKVMSCDCDSTGKVAAFFSGGLDAVHTLIQHLDESPDLISIWGSDIRHDNLEGWNKVYKGIQEYAQKYKLHNLVIKSSFRSFDKEGKLTQEFGEQLKDNWWHGVKHGLGLLGHAAPYAYVKGVSKIYFASTNCPDDKNVRCASNPLTDNNVRFVNVKVVHDGFEFSRQGKVHNLVKYVNHTRKQLSLHVCWKSQSGGNCSCCEKCYRTMIGLIAEGADPVDYGFVNVVENIRKSRNNLIDREVLYQEAAETYWPYIKGALIQNQHKLKNNIYWKDVKWLINTNVNNIAETPKSCSFRLRSYLSRFKFYQLLHEIKVKING